MKPHKALSLFLAAAALGASLGASAVDPRPMNPAAQARDERAAAGESTTANRPSEWMMLLAGLAIAGWIAARRSGSQE